MLLHVQIFKESISVADWQPSNSSYMCEEDLSAASSRVIVKAITSGVLTPKSRMSAASDGGMDESDMSECTTFKKDDLSFHTFMLLSSDNNEQGKNFYLVCVTTVDPTKKLM